MAVLGTGRGLGVILHGEHRQLLVAQALDGLVVQVDMGDLGLGGELIERAAVLAPDQIGVTVTPGGTR